MGASVRPYWFFMAYVMVGLIVVQLYARFVAQSYRMYNCTALFEKHSERTDPENFTLGRKIYAPLCPDRAATHTIVHLQYRGTWPFSS
jgi:hypothetical protein